MLELVGRRPRRASSPAGCRRARRCGTARSSRSCCRCRPRGAWPDDTRRRAAARLAFRADDSRAVPSTTPAPSPSSPRGDRRVERRRPRSSSSTRASCRAGRTCTTCSGRCSSRPSPTAITAVASSSPMAPAGSSGSSSTTPRRRPTSRRSSISLNVDSFEHLEFETRPDQLLVYALVQGDERVVIEYAPDRRRRTATRPTARAARVRHERLRPDGAAGPRGERGGLNRRVAGRDSTEARGRRTGAPTGGSDGERPRGGRPRTVARASREARRGSTRRAGISGRRDDFGPADDGLGRRARGFLQVRRAGDRTSVTEARAGPDHLHGHGLHHLPEREHHRQAAGARSRCGGGRDGAHRRDHDHRDGPGRELPVRAGRRPRHQRHRRVQPDRQGPRRQGRDGRHRPRGRDRSRSSWSSASARRS